MSSLLPLALGSQILILGDAMLDRARSGRVARACAEAPALVLNLASESCSPGGAALVALLARRLGADASLAAATGDDPDAALLRSLLDSAGIGTSALVADPARPTTAKERVLALGPAGPVQLLRLDRESADPLPLPVARLLAERAALLLPGCACVLVADHAKGVLSPGPVADLLASSPVPVLADPAKGVPLDRYRGCAALLPNRAEAEALLGRPIASRADGLAGAQEVLARSGASAVLLKMDADGLALAHRGGPPLHLPATAKAVHGVAGAGDMVLAACGVARAMGLDWPEAARLANRAAGLFVERGPDTPVTLDDLAEPPGKIVDADTLEALGERYRRQGKRIVFTNGCFDLLHAGHAACLEEASRLGDVLVVAVNADASVRRLKGPLRPAVPEADRVALVAALGCVAHVVLMADDTPHALLARLRPDVLAKGGDYAPSQVVGRELAESWGGRVIVTAWREGVSTTRLIDGISGRAG